MAFIWVSLCLIVIGLSWEQGGDDQGSRISPSWEVSWLGAEEAHSPMTMPLPGCSMLTQCAWYERVGTGAMFPPPSSSPSLSSEDMSCTQREQPPHSWEHRKY